MASSFAHQTPKKCYYQILNVSQSASMPEIKAAYRALALKLHPDQHGGCPNKQAQFQQLNQAYQILTNHDERHAYDQSAGIFTGGSTTKRHRPGVNPNYRKVYAPRPPPEWEFLWDHQKHQDMHYGTGMQRQAIRQAVRDAKKAGAFDYQSPLGRGFTFSNPNPNSNNEKNTSSSADCNKGGPLNQNPFSKHAPQGPPTVTFEYEEGRAAGLQGDDSSKARLDRKERIVHDMFQRRSQRQQETAAAAAQASNNTNPYPQYQRFQQRYTHGSTSTASTNSSATTQHQTNNNDCVIL